MEEIKNHPLYMRHNLDSAMSSLWDFYKKRFLSLFLISFVMSLVIQYASTFVNIQELTTMTDPAQLLEKIRGMAAPILIIFIINLVFNVILQYFIIFNPLDRSVNIIASLIKSGKYFIPYFLVMLILAFAGSVALALGLLLLVVGVFFAVIYVFTLYLFILPVMLVEGPNIGNTIQRTLALTHRNFWRNLGWVSVFLIILIVLSVILSGLILIPFTGNFLKTIMNPGEASELVNLTTNPLFLILSAAAGALTLPLIPLFSCILYFNGKAGEDIISQADLRNPDNNRVRVEDLYAKPYADDHPDNPENKK